MLYGLYLIVYISFGGQAHIDIRSYYWREGFVTSILLHNNFDVPNLISIGECRWLYER